MTEKYDFVTKDGKQPPNLALACWNRILLFHDSNKSPSPGIKPLASNVRYINWSPRPRIILENSTKEGPNWIPDIFFQQWGRLIPYLQPLIGGSFPSNLVYANVTSPPQPLSHPSLLKRGGNLHTYTLTSQRPAHYCTMTYYIVACVMQTYPSNPGVRMGFSGWGLVTWSASRLANIIYVPSRQWRNSVEKEHTPVIKGYTVDKVGHVMDEICSRWGKICPIPRIPTTLVNFL